MDSLDQSDLSGMLGDADTSQTYSESSALENTMSSNDEVHDTREVLHDTRIDQDAGPVSPLGNMWDRFLKRTMEAKSSHSAEVDRAEEKKEEHQQQSELVG